MKKLTLKTTKKLIRLLNNALHIKYGNEIITTTTLSM